MVVHIGDNLDAHLAADNSVQSGGRFTNVGLRCYGELAVAQGNRLATTTRRRRDSTGSSQAASGIREDDVPESYQRRKANTRAEALFLARERGWIWDILSKTAATHGDWYDRSRSRIEPSWDIPTNDQFAPCDAAIWCRIRHVRWWADHPNRRITERTQ